MKSRMTDSELARWADNDGGWSVMRAQRDHVAELETQLVAALKRAEEAERVLAEARDIHHSVYKEQLAERDALRAERDALKEERFVLCKGQDAISRRLEAAEKVMERILAKAGDAWRSKPPDVRPWWYVELEAALRDEPSEPTTSQVPTAGNTSSSAFTLEEQKRWHLCQHDILRSDCVECREPRRVDPGMPGKEGGK